MRWLHVVVWVVAVAGVLAGCHSIESVRANAPDEVRRFRGTPAAFATCMTTDHRVTERFLWEKRGYRVTRRNADDSEIEISDLLEGQDTNPISVLTARREVPDVVTIELRALHGLFGTTADEDQIWRWVEACLGPPLEP